MNPIAIAIALVYMVSIVTNLLMIFIYFIPNDDDEYNEPTN